MANGYAAFLFFCAHLFDHSLRGRAVGAANYKTFLVSLKVKIAYLLVEIWGGRCRENILRISKSLGVTCCVPDIHCRFDIVGRGGTTASGLKIVSRDFVLVIWLVLER